MSRNGNININTIIFSMGYREPFHDAHVADAVLSDRLNRIIFESTSSDMYLVGGYLRDIILGRPSFDRDFIIQGNVKEVAGRIAKILGCRLIEIGKRNLFRIVTGEGTTLDFLPIDQAVRHDLSSRDFTINALAWSPMSGLIDDHDGLFDLERKVIRIIAEENIKSDPVRILRAYRLSDELAFTIECITRNSLKYQGTLIAGVKSERITLELFRILNSPHTKNTLDIMLEDRVLEVIFHNSRDELLRKLKVIDNINGIIDKLPLKYKIKLYSLFSQNLTYQGLIRLEALLQDMTDNLLSLSKKTYERIYKLSTFLRKELSVTEECDTELMHGVFKELGDVSLDYLILSDLTQCLAAFERYDGIMNKGYLLTSEIMDATDLPQGKRLGNVIDRVRKAQFLNKIKSKEDALEYIKKMEDIF